MKFHKADQVKKQIDKYKCLKGGCDFYSIPSLQPSGTRKVFLILTNNIRHAINTKFNEGDICITGWKFSDHIRIGLDPIIMGLVTFISVLQLRLNLITLDKYWRKYKYWG